MAKSYSFVSEKGVAHVTADLNIRSKDPSSKGDYVKTVPPGTALKYIGYITDGENVGGKNACWYVSEYGDFFWAGNTTTKALNAVTVEGGKILYSPLKKLICTQRFGERPEVYKNWGSPKGHNGIDFRTRKADNPNDWKQDIFSVLAGVVTEAAENQANGKYVRVAHDNGYESVYLHLSSIDVKVAQKI